MRERAKAKAFLKERDIALEKVAALANTSIPTVSRFLTGARGGQRETASAIAKALACFGYHVEPGRLLMDEEADEHTVAA